jgi:CRP-like cAMP-binding protein
MPNVDAVVGDITHKSGAPDHDFLSGLTHAQRSRILSLGEEVAIPEGEEILGNGQRSKFCYLVLKGSVAVALSTPRLTVSVQVVGPGELFGWSALLQGQDSLFQVRAREHTTALRIPGAALAEVCKADSTLGVELLQRFLKVVAERVRATEIVFAEWCGVRVR